MFRHCEEFLNETGLELGDVYKSGCWSGLKRAAGVVDARAWAAWKTSWATRIGRCCTWKIHCGFDAYQRRSHRICRLSSMSRRRRLLVGTSFRLDASAQARRRSLDASLVLLHRTRPSSRNLRELLAAAR